jgi:hypothetical protein
MISPRYAGHIICYLTADAPRKLGPRNEPVLSGDVNSIPVLHRGELKGAASNEKRKKRTTEPEVSARLGTTQC